MNPAHDRGGVHLQAPFLHHLRQVPIRDPVLAVPTNTDQYDRDWERRRLNMNFILTTPQLQPTR